MEYPCILEFPENGVQVPGTKKAVEGVLIYPHSNKNNSVSLSYGEETGETLVAIHYFHDDWCKRIDLYLREGTISRLRAGGF